jgi:phosphoglycerate dehydrogenase-like enzyme
MAILVYTTPMPSTALVAALRRAAPDEVVCTEQDDVDPLKVEAMLAWRLKPGIVGNYPNLRVVTSIGAGAEKVLRATDLPADIPVTRVVDSTQAKTIAGFALACVLPFIRQLDIYREQQRNARWERHGTYATQRCRVGILGQGHVAQAVATAFESVGFPVAVWGRTLKDWPRWQSCAGLAGLADFLPQADVLVCTLPLTPQTQGLLDRSRLTMLPRGAFIVSIGRGGVLVEDDLRQALDDGNVAGAALDVFEREPLPPDHWLWGHPRVLVTPHIAGEPSPDAIAASCLEALRCARLGLPQPAAIDKSRGY